MLCDAPKYVKDVKPYVPGKPIEELKRQYGIDYIIKLASNENPLGPSPLAMEEAQRAIIDTGRYPDGGGYYLKDALSKHLGVDHDELILGNGSNELIDIAARAFMEPGDEAIVSDITFPIYRISTAKKGSIPVVVRLKDGAHDLEAMADRITGNTKIIFIDNPNNPMGTIVRKAEFDAFMARVPEDVLVVCDEAYYEYVTDRDYPNGLNYVKEQRCVLVLRTFSKVYGLAGFRIGYGVGPKGIIEYMKKIVEPFNTNSVSQRGAIYALKDKEHLKKTLALNESSMEYLYKELGGMGIECSESHTNFIYADLMRDARAIYEELLRRGVIIRPMGPTTVRITTGTEEENKRFIHKLKEVFR